MRESFCFKEERSVFLQPAATFVSKRQVSNTADVMALRAGLVKYERRGGKWAPVSSELHNHGRGGGGVRKLRFQGEHESMAIFSTWSHNDRRPPYALLITTHCPPAATGKQMIN